MLRALKIINSLELETGERIHRREIHKSLNELENWIRRVSSSRKETIFFCSTVDDRFSLNVSLAGDSERDRSVPVMMVDRFKH